jgi:hypothetical protein
VARITYLIIQADVVKNLFVVCTKGNHVDSNGVLISETTFGAKLNNCLVVTLYRQYSGETIKAFKSIEVPFFGFKVQAAGAIRPDDNLGKRERPWRAKLKMDDVQ